MAHQRTRYLEALLLHSVKHSAIVGVLGQRQTGKTTLIQRVVKEYETLDRRLSLEAAEKTPELFIAHRAQPFGIDECQLSPALFPALKEAVRILPKKGQFVLTGSVRFTSRKVIRESLTGRIFNHELLPLSIAESHHLPLPSGLVHFQTQTAEKAFVLNRRFSQSEIDSASKKLDHYLESGGLPGICFQREASVRATYFQSHLETLLERDLRLLQATTLSYPVLRNLLVLFAAGQGQPMDYAQLSREAQISVITLKKLISSFESIFLIRRALSSGGAQAPVFFMEDQGIASYLIQSSGVGYKPLQNLIRGLYGNIFPLFQYRPELSFQAFQYRTRGGALVPIAFKTIHGHLGIIPSLDSEPTATALGSARSFLKAHPKSKVVIFSRSGKPRVWNDALVSLPLAAMLR